MNNKVKILQRFGNVNLLSSIYYDKKTEIYRSCQVGSYKFLRRTLDGEAFAH